MSNSALAPLLTVDAAVPADVTFVVSGLASDMTGTVAFTDANGKQDVVDIGSNGTYSANLSNLATGTLTYLLSAKDPAGHAVNIDPTVTLGDGSTGAPGGAPQLPTLPKRLCDAAAVGGRRG